MHAVLFIYYQVYSAHDKTNAAFQFLSCEAFVSPRVYVPFILFECISKTIPVNSILKFAILSVFNVRNAII